MMPLHPLSFTFGLLLSSTSVMGHKTAFLTMGPASHQASRRSALQTVAGGVLGAVVGFSGGARTPAAQPPMAALPDEAYTTLGGDMKSCRVLNGMWQLSGAHGYKVEVNPQVVGAMKNYMDAGFNTFDAADHYGPAELVVGAYRESYEKEQGKGLFYTKWVPRPTKITRPMVKEAVGRSLTRMKTSRLDLLQFHWWEYDSPFYLDALGYLQELQQDGAIRHLGLTNFDTPRLRQITDNGIKIVSNQVQYSILDQRPSVHMASLSQERGIGLLAYGTLLGGFFSEKYLDMPPPQMYETVSQQKYAQMISSWGDWPKFQNLLKTLDKIAKKHGVTIANVAVRWVIQQPAVAGAIVGCRLGLKEHIAETQRVFSFKLDQEDLTAIQEAASQGRDLLKLIGEPGDEYRYRA